MSDLTDIVSNHGLKRETVRQIVRCIFLFSLKLHLQFAKHLYSKVSYKIRVIIIENWAIDFLASLPKCLEHDLKISLNEHSKNTRYIKYSEIVGFF